MQSVDRLFFAAFPDRAAAERISSLAFELRTRHRIRGLPLRTDRFHVSLCLIGNYYGLPPGLLAQVRDAVAGITMRPFKVMFDRVMSFKGRAGHRALVLCRGEGTPGLEMFQEKVQKAVAEAGFRHSSSPSIHPHVTLLYGDHDLPEQPVEPISWWVRELVLVHSLHGQTTYDTKERWLLRDGRPIEPVIEPGITDRGDRPINRNRSSGDHGD